MRFLLRLVAALFVAVTACGAAQAEAPGKRVLKIIGPKRDNLQYVAFWVAQGAKLFEAEGLALQLVTPRPEETSAQLLQRGDTQVALMSPVKYLQLIADRFPIVLVANLLQNDGINVIVRKDAADARKLSAAQPLKARLQALHGLKVGVAAGPPTRLRALFASQGLDADKEVTIVNLKGQAQVDAFAKNEVQVLYAHSPWAESALLDHDGVLLVNQSGGEVADLANREIFTLVVTRDFAKAHAADVQAMYRAIGRSEKLIAEKPAAAVDAVLAVFPAMDRKHVGKMIELYRPAMPKTPAVSVESVERALKMYPASKTAPNVAQVNLADYVATGLK